MKPLFLILGATALFAPFVAGRGGWAFKVAKKLIKLYEQLDPGLIDNAGISQGHVLVASSKLTEANLKELYQILAKLESFQSRIRGQAATKGHLGQRVKAKPTVRDDTQKLKQEFESLESEDQIKLTQLLDKLDWMDTTGQGPLVKSSSTAQPWAVAVPVA